MKHSPSFRRNSCQWFWENPIFPISYKIYSSREKRTSSSKKYIFQKRKASILQQNYSLTKRWNQVNSILERQKTPVIVGGTNYYIESLLWQVLVTDERSIDTSVKSKAESGDERANKQQEDVPLKRIKLVDAPQRTENLSNEELFQKLEEVDPQMARRLHPNNRRKVIR